MERGQRLKELREAAGLSQQKLAKLAGVTRNAVSQWESGQTRPTADRLSKLARALNVPMEQLSAPSAQVRGRLIEIAAREFERIGFAAVSIDAIAAEATIDASDLEMLFASKEDLFFEVARLHNERKLTDVRRSSARFGSLAARLKNLLRNLYVCDLEHSKVVIELHAYSWRWSQTREREYNRHMLEFHELIVELFDEAAAQGQIDTGNYRAASSLILAAYQLGFRKACFEACDADRLISFIEPQIAIILQGFKFRHIAGFSEADDQLAPD